ncbi:extracellular matrix protein 1-like isoform X1 [Sinocyclocheilus anshuiensis]|uniref:Extracellular matrix protein 1-like n=1 Tax=Sinocyclocheilus anshuiensis TaxID=1608454 RepID=A0A671RVT3_9TELE|nr:PREDICTED: extracellular matrix protein 1-like isoform X1 [Sinocyclocheilus anshuiensis]
MSSSRGVGLYLTLLLALLCDASEDSPVQREITDTLTDEDGLQQELPLTPEELDFLMMQRPVIPDLSKVLAAGSSDMTQREVTNFHPENVPIGRPVFGPRSRGPRMGPEVDFPPAFPNTGNLQDICQFSKAPLRYPKDMFPQDGFGHEHRQADAINQLQSWYGVCCGIDGTPEEQICCAEQAWKKSLSAYCTQEFSIKTSHYFCCKKSGKARWSCFDKEASDSSYHVSSEVSNGNTPQKIRGFKYNSSACKGSLVASPKALTKQSEVPYISFPPGRPDSSNVAHICAHHKIRPRYMPKCLPRTGYGWLVRQSKAINVLEREYSQCCKEKKSEQRCAEKKWKKMVDKFCKDEKKAKGQQFECCGKKKGEEQYSCFAASAPDPEYRSTDGELSPSAAPPTLDTLCHTHTAIQSMKGFPFSVDQMVERCCPLVLQERPACIEAELDRHLNDMCKVKELVKPHCCAPKIKNRVKCATKLLLRYIGKADKDSRRKNCPQLLLV